MAVEPAAIVPVALPDAAYDIVIGHDVLPAIAHYVDTAMHDQKISSFHIVTDETVGELYADVALSALGDRCRAAIRIPSGEKSKSFSMFECIIENLLEAGIDRHSVIIALGGGVVGDLAGFVAASILRGIRFVQIPTTLLAQVDSSVGGKTGINTAHGKNMCGAFHHPVCVIADTAVLATLPRREMRAGYAEIVKYALIDDAPFFEWLSQNGARIVAGDADALAIAIETSCRKKAQIVAADPLEKTGLRALLNLGHSFGHALEAIGGYDGRLLHGEAVAIGCCMAARFSERMGYAPAGTAARIEKIFADAGLPRVAPFAVTADEIMAHLRSDKKADGGKINLILLKGIGEAMTIKDVNQTVLQDFISADAVVRGV